jgi:hypothetical protein
MLIFVTVILGIMAIYWFVLMGFMITDRTSSNPGWATLFFFAALITITCCFITVLKHNEIDALESKLTACELPDSDFPDNSKDF